MHRKNHDATGVWVDLVHVYVPRPYDQVTVFHIARARGA
jgi:hypothetical protein